MTVSIDKIENNNKTVMTKTLVNFPYQRFTCLVWGI